MLDINSNEVNIGDKVYIAHGKLLYEAVFIKETKTSFIVKAKDQDRGYSIPKITREYNTLYDDKEYWKARHAGLQYNVPMYLDKDISQEPCKRIIKI